MSLGNGCKVRHYFFLTKLLRVFFIINVFFYEKYMLLRAV